MKLTFVGTSHGIPEADRFCTAMFLEIGDNCYIIDAGAPVSPMLLRYGIRHEAVKGVFITHLHGDHFDGLFEFCDQLSWRYLTAEPEILLPEEKGVLLLASFLETMITTKRELSIWTYNKGKIFEDENISVTAIPTDHSKLPSFAFLISAEGKTVLFSGDMSAEFTEADRLFKDRELDLVVFEGAHAELKNYGGLLGSINTKKMIINHYYEQRNSAKDIEALQKELSYDIFVAYDGMTVEL